MDDQRDYQEEAANRQLLADGEQEADGPLPGERVLVTLALPLPAALAAGLMYAIADVTARHGYTGVALVTDGSNRIVGTPPR